jgi:hypothetical protein
MLPVRSLKGQLFLALIFAPNILRTAATDADTVYFNATYEARFVLNLLRYVDPQTGDPDYQVQPPMPACRWSETPITARDDYDALSRFKMDD